MNRKHKKILFLTLAVLFIALLAWIGITVAYSQTQPTTSTRPAYTPAAKVAVLTATRCYQNDKVSAAAGVPNTAYDGWYNPFHVADPIPGITTFPWSNNSIGCDIDTSKAGTFQITKNGQNLGTLKVLPALPVVKVRVANPAELYTALVAPSCNLQNLTTITLASGIYDLVGPNQPGSPWWGINVQGNVKLVAEGKVTLRADGFPAGQASLVMLKGDLYIDGCTLVGPLWSMNADWRLTLTDCVIANDAAGKNTGGYGSALKNFTMLRGKVGAGAGLYISDNTLVYGSEFVSEKTHCIKLDGTNVAIYRASFHDCARAIVIGGSNGAIIEGCTIDNVVGFGGNEGECFLFENKTPVKNVGVVSNKFFNSVGTGVQFSAENKCSGNIVAYNTISGPKIGILFYSQEITGSFDDNAVFGNSVDNAQIAFVAEVGVGSSTINTRGGNNVFTNQSPRPSHNGLPQITAGDFNTYPLRYTDCTIVKLPSGQNTLKTTGKFYVEQIGVTCTLVINNIICTFTPTQFIDDQTMAFGGWANLTNTGAVPAFNIPGVATIYTVPGNNTVGWTVAKPYAKTYNFGDAQVKVK